MFVAGDEEPKEQAVRKKGSNYIFQSIINREKFITEHNDDVFCIATTRRGNRGTCVMSRDENAK
jgi:hypothetical protein